MSVWMRAAKLIGNEKAHSCCGALGRLFPAIEADFDAWNARTHCLRDWFRDENSPMFTGGYWWGYPSEDRNGRYRTARVIALCLMHEMEKDGQL